MGLLDGKVALVTGAGRGIGAAAARLFANEGAALLLNDFDAAPVEGIVQAIRKAKGEALAVVGDVIEETFPARFTQAAMEAYRRIDILVNNAGFPWDALIEDTTHEHWLAMMELHAWAPHQLLQAALPVLKQAALNDLAEGKPLPSARKVVNVSSIAALYGNQGQTTYGAAKAAVIGLTRSLAREWGTWNIQVNCACFGAIATRQAAEKGQGETIVRGSHRIALGVPKETLERVQAAGALERLGTSEEAARVLLFFASPLSDFVTGQVLEVSGGYSG